MKIVICASSFFAKNMIEIGDKLGKLGHEVIIHPDYHELAADADHPNFARIERGEHAEIKKENGYVRWYFDRIRESDAILVLNFEKRGVKNYIGGNTLMEIGVAYHEKKKIFLLHPPPEISYRDEILATMTAVIDGDLTKIR